MPFDTELGIPSPNAQSVEMRCSPYPRPGSFKPESWSRYPLSKKSDGWWVLNIPGCGLADGAYEYEFLLSFSDPNPGVVIATDPYAEELVKFSGYRALMHIRGGRRVRQRFDWDDEPLPGFSLAQNHQMIIYELPLRWVDAPDEAQIRQVDLGTFDKLIFEHLKYIKDLGCNAIELLPIQDSPDTLNWGYGTRFFYAPDWDMGDPFDLKSLIQACHKSGIRVILDIVMNHARGCPLRDMAKDWYFGDEANRNAWGGDLFKFRSSTDGNFYPAREWHYAMADFWIKEYHVDGFRLDEFNGIDNWDFLREFRNRAWKSHQEIFPSRPFIVIAEDSARRPEAAQDITKGGKVADAIWDFDFRDEVRRLCSNGIWTVWGKPSRSERVRGLITGGGMIDGDDWRQMWNGTANGGNGAREHAKFGAPDQRVPYITSHDVKGDWEQRLYPFFLWRWQQESGADWDTVLQGYAHALAVDQVVSAFAILLTSVGMPMFLAGEEFADLHDIPHWDDNSKMSDPIDWRRMYVRGHDKVAERVRSLIGLRASAPCLHGKEVEFFGMQNGFHARFDENDGDRVFAYCRTGGQWVGSSHQVAVVCNAGPSKYDSFWLEWPWGNAFVSDEKGGVDQPSIEVNGNAANIPLRPFQTRVFLMA